MMLAVGNAASELGPSRVPWWLDWRGQPCAVVASGSSLCKADVDLLKGRLHVAVVKEGFRLIPEAEVIYSCHTHWWRHVRGLPDYRGLKLAYEKDACFCGIKLISIPETKRDELLFDEPGVVGSGGNSGFQLFNLVAQFGASKILLVGFDMHGPHWYGRNNWDFANNPDQMNFKRWTKAFNGCEPRLKSLGVDVINCSARSSITAFRKMGVKEALELWGL